MPIYRFLCNSCKDEFTALCSMGQEHEVRCKSCNSQDIARLLPRSFVGKTAEGKRIAGGGCSTCTASSCQGCSR
jgi:putative FmdB family regulatory protein